MENKHGIKYHITATYRSNSWKYFEIRIGAAVGLIVGNLHTIIQSILGRISQFNKAIIARPVT